MMKILIILAIIIELTYSISISQTFLFEKQYNFYSTEIDLSQSNITEIDINTFQGFIHLKTIYLQGNQLERLESGLFNGLVDLRSIWLESNNIISIDRNIFIGLNKLEQVCLIQNPISNSFSILSLCQFNQYCQIKTSQKCMHYSTRFELEANVTGHSYGGIYALAILSNNLIVTGSGDTKIKVWNYTQSSFELVATLEGHTNYVWSLAVLKNGNIVSGGWDTTIKVWNS